MNKKSKTRHLFASFEDKSNEYQELRKEELKVSVYDKDIDENFDNVQSINIDTSELFTNINKVPLAIQSKNIDVGNYNRKYERFFEEFYIVGVDELTLQTINNKQDIVRPTLLYNYPNHQEHSERHKIVKDFWFSSGVPVKQWDLSVPDQDSDISRVSIFKNFNFCLGLILKTSNSRKLIYVYT